MRNNYRGRGGRGPAVRTCLILRGVVPHELAPHCLFSNIYPSLTLG